MATNAHECTQIFAARHLITFRQAEYEVSDDVALDLGRSGLDRVPTAAQIAIRPLAVIERIRRSVIELTIWTLNFHRDLLESLVQLAPENLLDRTFRSRHA